MNYKEVINIFENMLKNKWGYILGTSGELWTKEKQERKKINGGEKWIGHVVADCSGAFVYTLKQGNIYVYHGSNRIARYYVEKLLPMSQAKPGMIAFKYKVKGQEGYSLPADYKGGGKYFNGDLNDYYHCGLVVEDGVINLQSTNTGCVKSAITQNWNKCGYIKGVVYEDKAEKTINIPYDLAMQLYSVLAGEFK